MKKNILTLAIALLFISAIYAQQNQELFLGPTVSFYEEIRNNMKMDDRNVKSHTKFFGTGVRAQQRLNESWGFTIGINYVKRQYESLVPYNHCLFDGDGLLCDDILEFANRYGYQTIEIPVGINKYFSAQGVWEFYYNLTVLTAYDFQAYYHPGYSSKKGNEIDHAFNAFSGSLTGGMGFGFDLTEKVKINLEPFVRLVYTQREDCILSSSVRKDWTYFDNFGAHLSILYRL